MAEHGGNIYKASRISGYCQDKILDFSANINPLGLPFLAREAIITNLDGVVNYPEPGNPRLVSALAGYHGVRDERVITGNGATEIIYLTIRAVNPGRALVLAPSFSEYCRALNTVGCRVEFFQLKEEAGFALDVEGLINRLSDEFHMLLLCNPNNPTGTVVNSDDMKHIIEKAAELGIYVMVDEAFMDFVEDHDKYSMVKCLEDYTNLVIVRAFTKFFGFPGLRLGYGLIGSNRLKLIMENIKEPWSVNFLAEKAGIASLNDVEYIKKTREWLGSEKIYLFKALENMEGIKPYRSSANFILSRILRPGMGAGKLQDLMLQRGILIRNAGNFQGLDDSYVRLAVKSREANRCLVQVLEEILKSEASGDES